MQQRYYDPAIGAFLSGDPVAASPNTGASFCRYCYANNNPHRFTDPDGRAACQGKEANACLISDTAATGSSNVKILDGAGQVVVQNRGDFATSKPSHEKGGDVRQNSDGTFSSKVQNGAVSTNHGPTATIPITLSANSVAAVHSHSDVNMTLATANRGTGDVDPLISSRPVPFVTINRDRVMVRELVNGQLQVRMLEGVMTPKEVELVQKNINREQGLVNDN